MPGAETQPLPIHLFPNVLIFTEAIKNYYVGQWLWVAGRKQPEVLKVECFSFEQVEILKAYETAIE